MTRACANGWDDPTYLECMLCSKDESCEQFKLRRFWVAKSHIKAFGLDVPDNVTTIEQLDELFEIDRRDDGIHGVRRR